MASSTTLTRPVREAVNTTAKTKAANSPAAQRPRNRPSCSSTATAMQLHSSRLLRWLGWRRLPTARPGKPECAIQSPSTAPGQNTCTAAMPTLSAPATTQPQQKAAKRSTAAMALSSACRRARALAPLATITAAASKEPISDSARLAGSDAPSHDHRPAATSKAMAACSTATPRPATSGAATSANAGHRAKARAWFRKVGEGATL